MRRIAIQVDHDLEARDLLPALLAVVEDAGIAEPLFKALGDTHESREPIREAWMLQLVHHFRRAGKRLDQDMAANVERLIANMTGIPLRKARKGAARNLMLSQAQVDELLTMIRMHYRVAIRAGGADTTWGIDAALEARWKVLGLLRPEVTLAATVSDAFTAGRLSQILEDGASLADMRRMAKELPESREAELTRLAVQDRVGYDLVGGVGYKAEVDAGRMIIGENSARVAEIVGQYRAGKLKATPTNRTGLSAEEMDALGEDRAVSGWRGVARELRNRMAEPDRSRDWERVAASSLRMTANIGAISALQEQGADELWYDVAPTACDHCKRMYLDDRGQPLVFSVNEIMAEITTTGGANYGRKTRDYKPTALLHPWCQCRPKKKLASVAPKGRINAAGQAKPS